MTRMFVVVAAAAFLSGCTTDPFADGPASSGSEPYGPGAAAASDRDAEVPVSAPDGTPMIRLWVALPTGDRATSVLLLEQFTPAEVIAGQPFDSEIRVTNLTRLCLDNVVVTDEMPGSYRLAAATPDGSPDDKGAIAWNLGSLGPKESRSIKVTGSAAQTGTISSCLGATYTSGLCSSVNIVRPELRLTMSAPEAATTCGDIPVRFTVTNAGTGTARNVHIRQELPDGLTAADGRSSIDLDVGSLAADETRDVTVRLRAARTGAFGGNAVATGSGGLNAESSAVTIDVRQPSLAVKATAPPRLILGRPAVYEITVTNTGEAPALNTTIEQQVPAGGALATASDNGRLNGSNISWSLGTLAPGESRTTTATLGYAAPGQAHSVITVRAECAQAMTATADTDIAGVPALLLDGADSPDPVQVGETTTYTLTLTNQGSAPLSDVLLACTMDEGDTMEFLSAGSAPSSPRVEARQISFPPVATLSPKQSVTYRITVRALREGQVSFRAEATSREITRPLIKSETTNFYR